MNEYDLRQIAKVCLTLRKRADFFLSNEPQNLNVEDFDAIAMELEEMAQVVDSLIASVPEKGNGG